MNLIGRLTRFRLRRPLPALMEELADTRLRYRSGTLAVRAGRSPRPQVHA